MYRTTASKSTTRHSQGNFSAVDVEHPDLDRFPEFSLATAYEVIVGPGDFVYIPAKCWHSRPRTHAVDKHQLLVLDIEYQCIDWPLNRIDSPLAAVRALGSRVSSLNRFNLRHVRRHSASLTALGRIIAS